MRSNRSSNIDGPVAGEYFSRVRLLYQLSGPWLRICVLSDPVGAPKWGRGRERGTGAYVMALLPRGLKVHLALGYPSARSGNWRTEKSETSNIIRFEHTKTGDDLRITTRVPTGRESGRTLWCQGAPTRTCC